MAFEWLGPLAGSAIGGLAGSLGSSSSGDWSSNVSLGPTSNFQNFLSGNQIDRKFSDDQIESELAKLPWSGPLGSQLREQMREKLRAETIHRAPQNGFLQQNFQSLNAMVQAGPGQQDVEASTGASRSLADMLQQYQSGGYMPNDADISSSNTLAEKLFAAQRVGLNQSMQDQTVAANRAAALQGGSGNDPILQAKLRTQLMRQTDLLNANQGGFAAQYAQQQPMQRLGFAQQRVDVLGGLASQAMANRQALQAIGQGALGQEQNFQFQTSRKYGTQSNQSGGGPGGAISGGLAGLGAGMSFASMMGAGGNNNRLSFGNPVANNFFNQDSYQFGQPQAQMPVFSPFTGPGQAPTPLFSGGQPRQFSLGGNY